MRASRAPGPGLGSRARACAPTSRESMASACPGGPWTRAPPEHPGRAGGGREEAESSLEGGQAEARPGKGWKCGNRVREGWGGGSRAGDTPDLWSRSREGHCPPLGGPSHPNSQPCAWSTSDSPLKGSQQTGWGLAQTQDRPVSEGGKVPPLADRTPKSLPSQKTGLELPLSNSTHPCSPESSSHPCPSPRIVCRGFQTPGREPSPALWPGEQSSQCHPLGVTGPCTAFCGSP